ncbi:MAG TPA: hypothetical protein VFI09_08500, partial [Solirubrobacterales bacterium]|nr:hypothetical protein [Solirubrobacterales bacterium]
KSGLEGIGLSNFGSGSERGVSAKFESISIPYTKVSGTLTSCGSASGSTTLKGTSVMRGF